MPGYPEQPQKSLWQRANQSLVPEDALMGLQNSIDNPTLDRSPWEARAQGFAAGALGGLADLATPVNLAATLASGGVGGALGRGAGSAMRMMSPARGGNPQAFNRALATVRQTQRAPRSYEVSGLEQQLKQRLSQIPTGSGPGDF